MKNKLVILFSLLSFVAISQTTLSNEQLIGQATRNQKVGKGLRVPDTLMVNGLLTADSFKFLNSLPISTNGAYSVNVTSSGKFVVGQLADTTLWKYNQLSKTIYSYKNDSTSLLFGADTISTAGNTGVYFNLQKFAFRAGQGIWADDSLGSGSTAMGYRTTASGDVSTAMGGITTASGDGSTAMGAETTASGDGSTAMGYRTTASGDYSTAMGELTTSNGYASLVIGRFNNTLVGAETVMTATTPLFIVGNGTSSSDLHNAFVVRNNGTVEIDSLPNTTVGDSLLTSVNGVLSKVSLYSVLHPIYITHGSVFVDSSTSAYGIAAPNKNADSIFLPNLVKSYSSVLYQSSRVVKSISAPSLEEILGGLNISGCANLAKVNMKNLRMVFSGLSVNNLPSVDSLSFDSLQYLGTDFIASGNTTMKHLSVKSLKSLGGQFTVQGDSMLTTLDLSSVLDFSNVVVTTGCKNLTTLILNPALKCGFVATFTLNGCAFTQPSVDAILAALDASGVTGGTVNLSGGTSATPSAGGLVSKANLVGKGWTVTHN